MIADDQVVLVLVADQAGLNEVNGHRSCTLVNMAIIAVRLGRKLQFDPDTQRFINDDEANRLIKQPMRAPWVI